MTQTAKMIDLPASPRILIIKLWAIGDVLMATPILTGIKKLFPQSEVMWIVDANASGILAANPLIDHLITIDFGPWRKMLRNGNILGYARRTWEMRRDLTARRFDVAINLTPEKSWTRLLCAAPVQIAMFPSVSPNPSLHRQYTHPLYLPADARAYAAEFYVHPLTLLGGERSHPGMNSGARIEDRPSGIEESTPPRPSPPGRESEDTSPQPSPWKGEGQEGPRTPWLSPPGSESLDLKMILRIRDADRRAVDNLLRPHESTINGRRLIVLHPGSSQESKCWLPEQFRDLAIRLSKEFAIVITGSSDEAKLAEGVAFGLRGVDAPIIACGRLTHILETAALVERAAAVVTGDTATVHIASAIGTPVVCIYGSTRPGHNRPQFGPNELLFDDSISCAPCYKRICCLRGEENMRCMRSITPETVEGKVRALTDQAVRTAYS